MTVVVGERCDCLANAVNVRLTALHLKWVMCVVLGFKVLGFYVFRTLICIVGKS